MENGLHGDRQHSNGKLHILVKQLLEPQISKELGTGTKDRGVIQNIPACIMVANPFGGTSQTVASLVMNSFISIIRNERCRLLITMRPEFAACSW